MAITALNAPEAMLDAQLMLTIKWKQLFLLSKSYKLLKTFLALQIKFKNENYSIVGFDTWIDKFDRVKEGPYRTGSIIVWSY